MTRFVCRNFTLDLFPNRDVFSSDAMFLVHTNNGIISSSYDPQTFYKGVIIGKIRFDQQIFKLL